MNRILAFVIFFGIFLSIYLGMHFYVFVRLGTLFNIKRAWQFYAVAIMLTLLFPLASFVERGFAGSGGRMLYTAASTWFGILFLLFCSVLLYDALHFFVKVKPFFAGIAIVAVVLALSIFAILNARFITVREIEIPMKGLEKEMRVVQLSDLHVGTTLTSGFVEKVVEKTNKLEPDLVLITGDLVDSSGPLIEDSLMPLKNLNAKSFFTTGNHEQYADLDKVIPMIEAAGTKVLRNEVVEYSGLQIVGIDNPGDRFRGGNDIIGKLQIDKKKPSVLMYHPPEGLEQASAAGINLQLSGHTHYGQIIPFNFLVKLFYPRIRGLYELNGTYLYVSTGTGFWGPPMRLGPRSEITLIKLVKA